MSPYNLWSVRIVRYLTVFLTLVTFVWWVLQLVSAFVTIPGFHTRASGFFSFSYASIALANLLVTLVFFAVPAKAVRVLSVAMGGFLLLDAILLLAVEKTRYEEGWVGMASVLCKSNRLLVLKVYYSCADDAYRGIFHCRLGACHGPLSPLGQA